MGAAHSGAAPGDLAEYLAWDSQFFELRIARVRAQRMTSEQAGAILEWCAANAIDCLYFLAAGDPPTVAVAESHGFALVDIRVTYEHNLTALPEPPTGVRQVRPSDLERLKQLTGRGFADSRFYADPHFDRAKCDALYTTWIERSCQGYANQVLVTERNGEPAGYVTCNLGTQTASAATGNIGLVAVDASAQGEGAGRRLVISALHYFQEQRMTCATVVTQARNIPSQRLYQRCGFLLQSTALWYHRWFTTR